MYSYESFYKVYGLVCVKPPVINFSGVGTLWKIQGQWLLSIQIISVRLLTECTGASHTPWLAMTADEMTATSSYNSHASSWPFQAGYFVENNGINEC